MKKIITITKVWSLIYWTVYLVKSFYQWQLRNPFQWMLDLPNDQVLREHILMSIPVLLFFCLFFYFAGLDENGKLRKTDY